MSSSSAIDPLAAQLPPPKKRSSGRKRVKTPDFPIPTPPELREWANRNRQVRIALPISDTQLHIVSPYSDEQEPPLLVSSCSMGTQSSSSDDGPSTPDSDRTHGTDGTGDLGYFGSQSKTQVDEDPDETGLFFTIGKKSTSSLRVPYRSLKAVKDEAISTEVIKVEEAKVEAVSVDEARENVKEGAKVVERPPQELPPPEWTGGQNWRKVRYLDKETGESKATFNIHAWAAARRAALLEQEEDQSHDPSEPTSPQQMMKDLAKLTSHGMMTYMIFASIPRLHQFVQTGFAIDPVEWIVVGSSFTFFVASVCGVIC